MKIPRIIADLRSDKKMMTVVFVLGMAGLLLILLSSVVPDKKGSSQGAENTVSDITSAESYCAETEQKLSQFLAKIKGAGTVRVYLSVGSGERYVYVSEGKRSKTENKTEEEEKYVIIGGNGEKKPLIETVRRPVIEGAVVICSGCDDPSVREQIYRAASAALGISTGKIYVAKGN